MKRAILRFDLPPNFREIRYPDNCISCLHVFNEFFIYCKKYPKPGVSCKMSPFTICDDFTRKEDEA
jgi:hypothetical protein